MPEETIKTYTNVGLRLVRDLENKIDTLLVSVRDGKGAVIFERALLAKGPPCASEVLSPVKEDCKEPELPTTGPGAPTLGPRGEGQGSPPVPERPAGS